MNLSDDDDINRAWESIIDNTKTTTKGSLGLHDLKQHKAWLEDEWSGFLDQRKQAKCSGYRIQIKAMLII